MALTSGTRLGAYEIVGLIGAGGMGEVYRARDTKLKRDVAIKVLPARSRSAGVTESSAYRADLRTGGSGRRALSDHGVRRRRNAS